MGTNGRPANGWRRDIDTVIIESGKRDKVLHGKQPRLKHVGHKIEIQGYIFPESRLRRPIVKDRSALRPHRALDLQKGVKRMHRRVAQMILIRMVL